jgi:hypothetical protein
MQIEHVMLEDNGHDVVMTNTWSFENFLTILLQSLFSSVNEMPSEMKVNPYFNPSFLFLILLSFFLLSYPSNHFSG